MRRARKGFTLAEVIVMSLIFSIFSATAVAGLTLALRYWSQTNERMLAEQNARVAMATITAEARQAIVASDPYSGYKTINPAVSATGFLTPNANSTTGDSLVFSEPSSTYNPLSDTFSDTDATNYQRVSYYVTNNSLHRQVITYNSGGGISGTDDAVLVAASSNGSLILSTQYKTPTTVHLQITSVETLYSYTLSSDVTMVGQ
jgi:type II secretory pathway component PulJ